MDVRLTAEQQQLRDAATKLADDLGPGSVSDLAGEDRIARLDRQIAATGWRSLRSDGASGVEVAIIAEEFGRRLVDAPFLGPVLADDLARHLDTERGDSTIAVDGLAFDTRGYRRALLLSGTTVLAAELDTGHAGADLTRVTTGIVEPPLPVGELSADAAGRWRALALVATAADLVGDARGVHTLACDYAKIREQYGKPIGSYQAVAHLLAESLALIEGSISILRHAAWAVDELEPPEAVRAARVAKVYCARATQTVCETAVQVHGGIGNTWDCLAHVYLRRALTSTNLWPVSLKEVGRGLS
ncbi:Caffeyl-CoA reductase-Etf complex subunit CarC [Mycobacterium persicum]|uniref:Caffeyl-CoA reductase-Etf complex subunit CarC n=1 Tax=Mycobacterium persicum TaxID=1487726 RepID=A0ABY6RPV5_9MYCO|nr:acyl-CoA dehydrogenase family protein [Mycobacterium persicum]ORB52543.1 acyl-CoA dehydrogenase [Mycobacterium persicum]ORB94919.1 acyl-CoA dehydrogenase [Mycobacterium persicum]ORC01674.1 acyl-CoA dehydrogenase [Mycobacterium persicum]VAZ79571.1 Caffeyl-CoA reductase-Etf complex subunit CarC [Mycobacterium persicum]VAZ99588.1 Caffeyl-CoA reductase-Etf complex subunit CarC [Mycobacterium persicum]